MFIQVFLLGFYQMDNKNVGSEKLIQMKIIRESVHFI